MIPTIASVDAVPTPGSPPSLQIQTVLFGHSSEDVDRFLTSTAATVVAARHSIDLGHVGLVAGDCSPMAILSPQVVDRHRKTMESSGIRFDYRFFGQNLGSAAGHNELLKQHESDLVLVINPDIYASPDCLTELIRCASGIEIGIAEGRQVPLEHPKEFDRSTGDTSWASTACALVRRSVIDAIGGFDAETFFLYCDDVDFSWRARLAGFRVVYCPTASIFHDKRLDGGAQVVVGQAEVYYSAEASLMMAWKYSRLDLVDQWSAGLLQTGTPHHRRAVETFRSREQDGSLPPQLDPEGKVAQFVGYAFAEHRFGYDD